MSFCNNSIPRLYPGGLDISSYLRDADINSHLLLVEGCGPGTRISHGCSTRTPRLPGETHLRATKAFRAASSRCLHVPTDTHQHRSRHDQRFWTAWTNQKMTADRFRGDLSSPQLSPIQHVLRSMDLLVYQLLSWAVGSGGC